VRAFVSSIGLAALLTLVQLSDAVAQDRSSRLQQLHDDLHLTATQEVAWGAYAMAVSPDPMTEARHQAAVKLMPGLTAPRRIALIDATMSQDLDDFRREGAAVKTFYVTLTQDQQKIFDQETVPATTQTPD
jgi:hypothetical protein